MPSVPRNQLRGRSAVRSSLDADVIIVGAGAAGIAAAIEAATAGARTIVLEQERATGGSAGLSSGGCLLVDTPLQRAQGIRDSVKLAFEDWIRCGQGAADQTWVRFYLEHSAGDLYDWTESMGVRWTQVKSLTGNSAPRWHRAQGEGAGLMNALLARARDLSIIHIRTSASAQELLVDGEGAYGVRVSGLKAIQSLHAAAVVVATGGFASNHGMVVEQHPELERSGVLTGSGPGSTGSGHRMIESVGGHLTHMDLIWFYVYATPDLRDPKGQRGLVFRVTPAYIWVNQAGRRFHDETRAGAAAATPALLAQSPPSAWAILDSRMAAAMEVEDLTAGRIGGDPRALAREVLAVSPFVRRADSLADLGTKMQIDVPVFLGEVSRYHAAIDAGHAVEPDFGRPLAASTRFEHPPFYGIQLLPLARKTLGGVRTDLRCTVLNAQGEPIRGLFAAGEVAGMAGGHINGKGALEGTMLGPSIFSGRVAGAWAAHEAGFGPGFVGRRNISGAGR